MKKSEPTASLSLARNLERNADGTGSEYGVPGFRIGRNTGGYRCPAVDGHVLGRGGGIVGRTARQMMLIA
jgi:hypothetical protein